MANRSRFVWILAGAVVGSAVLWGPGHSRASTPMVLAAPPVSSELESHWLTTGGMEPPQLQALFDPADAEGVLVELYAENTRERLSVRIPTDAESIDDELLRTMRHFLRCHRTGRQHRIQPRLLASLARIAKRFPGHSIEVVSAYRARPYGVPGSRHYQGRAVDFRVIGVPIEEVRSYVWDHMDDVGVGHYHQQGFIHLDTRRGEKIGWDQRREGQNYRYNPRWAQPST